MTVLSVPAMAQVSIADAVKEIKSSKDAKATEAVVKQAYKLVKKNITVMSISQMETATEMNSWKPYQI